MKPALAILLAMLCAGAGSNEEGSRSPRQEITPATLKAIDKGLKSLASRMSRRGEMTGTYPVATTSLACLAFLASGSTPHQGTYAGHIRRGL